MATRGSIPKVMEAAGIDMLPPEVGIPTVRRELVAGGGSGEIVVAGRLGILGDRVGRRRGASTSAGWPAPWRRASGRSSWSGVSRRAASTAA